MGDWRDKDLGTLLRQELERAPEVQAVVNAYADLNEAGKTLFRLAAGVSLDTPVSPGETSRPVDETAASATPTDTSPAKAGQIQPLVQNLMKTLLEDYPTLLDGKDIRNLLDRDYCKKDLGLKLGNLPLLRRTENGKQILGHNRYWKDPRRDGRFYVCSQWWKKHHLSNAESLLRFVDKLVIRDPAHSGIPALERHRNALNDYIAQFSVDG